MFLALGANAKPLWFDAEGITPLTARLFASPLTGLGLGLILVSRANDWRSVMVPAIGMITIGVVGTLSLVLDKASFLPQSGAAWFIAATPAMLFAIGLAHSLVAPGNQGAAGVNLLWLSRRHMFSSDRSIQMKIKVVVHEAEEGGFWAEVPVIPGCATEGETMDELLRNLREAIEGCLSDAAEIADEELR